MNIVSDNIKPFNWQTPPTPESTPEPSPGRHVRLFRNGANQAVRIPKEFEMPGVEAILRREGTRLVLEPVLPLYEKGSPAAILAMLDTLAKLGPCDDVFPDVDEGLLPMEPVNL